MKSNRKGFTIVELVIAIAIVTVLAAVLIPTFSNVVSKAKESKDYANALNIYKEQILALKSSNSLIDKDGDNKEEILVILQSDGKTKYYLFVNGKGTLLESKLSLDEYDLVFNEDGLDSSIITEIDAVKQKSMIAYNEYKLTNENANNYCFLYQEESYYVVISKGLVYAVTDDAEEYINLLNGLVDNPNTDGIDGEFILTNTQNSQLFKFNCVKRRIYIDANKRLIGAVDSRDGTVDAYTNNWYYDVQIPEGSKKVEILSFKTGQSYGSVFFDDSDTVISGYYNNDNYQKTTINIPENATMYRYGYVIDSIAKDSPIGVFEYLTFFGDDISYEIQPKKINTIVKESFITRYSQNTLYYQKFNVSGKSAIASHQYQQNIMAAQSQGESLKKYYGTYYQKSTTNKVKLHKIRHFPRFHRPLQYSQYNCCHHIFVLLLPNNCMPDCNKPAYQT